MAKSIGKTSGLPRMDGWQNLLQGFGVKGVDRRTNTKYAPTLPLDPETLRNMYRGDGLARRIVELPVLNMTRRGFDILADTDGKVNEHFEEIGIHGSVRDLLRWSKLYGGAIGVLGLDDGGKLEDPLNENKLKRLHFMRVYHRWRLSWTTADLYQDPEHPKYGTPEWYLVSPIRQLGGGIFRVHETRVIRAEGEPVDDFTRITNFTWGDSVLQAPYDQIRAMASTYGGCELVVDDFVQAVITMKGLALSLATGREKQVRDRLNFLDLSKHMLNTKLLDSDGEKYEKHTSSITGLPELLDRFAGALSATTGIPTTLLMGKAPAGLNATGDADIRQWYDNLRSQQEEVLQPIYERLCYLEFISREGDFGGKEPDGWKIDFRPLWEPTEKEKGDARKVVADADKIYLDSGVVDPIEVRNSRFGGDRYSPETKLVAGVNPEQVATAATEAKKKKTEQFQVASGEPPGAGNAASEDRTAEGHMGNEPQKKDSDLMARLSGDDKTTIQTLLLSKSKFKTKAEAQAWAKDHDRKTGVDEKPETWRMRQLDPGKFVKGSFKTITLTEGVEAVIGHLKS